MDVSHEGREHRIRMLWSILDQRPTMLQASSILGCGITSTWNLFKSLEARGIIKREPRTCAYQILQPWQWFED